MADEYQSAPDLVAPLVQMLQRARNDIERLTAVASGVPFVGRSVTNSDAELTKAAIDELLSRQEYQIWR